MRAEHEGLDDMDHKLEPKSPSQYKIEDKPYPKGRTQNATARFPFGMLEIGQSFLVPRELGKKLSAAMTCYKSYRRDSNVKFRTAREGDQIRVYRTA